MYPLVNWGPEKTSKRLNQLLDDELLHELLVVVSQLIEQILRRYIMYFMNDQKIAYDFKLKKNITINCREKRNKYLYSYQGIDRWKRVWKEIPVKKKGMLNLPTLFDKTIGDGSWRILVNKGAVNFQHKNNTENCKCGLFALHHKIVHGVNSPIKQDVELLARWGISAIEKVMNPDDGFSKYLSWNVFQRIPLFRGPKNIVQDREVCLEDISVVQGKYSNGNLELAGNDISIIKHYAFNNVIKRARICAHPSDKEPIHEMLICFHKDSYIRPHRHKCKTESFHVIEGDVEVIFFHDTGKIKNRIRLSGYTGTRSRPFFFRSTNNDWHTIIIKSEFAIIHETTNGPFDSDESVYAPWSPISGQEEAIKKFIRGLNSKD